MYPVRIRYHITDPDLAGKGGIVGFHSIGSDSLGNKRTNIESQSHRENLIVKQVRLCKTPRSLFWQRVAAGDIPKYQNGPPTSEQIKKTDTYYRKRLSTFQATCFKIARGGYGIKLVRLDHDQSFCVW